MNQIPDLWHELTKTADHNRGVLFATLIAGLMSLYLAGCDVTTASLTDPTQSVTAHQLQIEFNQLQTSLAKRKQQLEIQLSAYNQDVQALNQRLQTARKDLARKMQWRQKMVQTLGGLAIGAAQGNVNPLSALSTLIGLLSVGSAIGLGVDNRRKNKIIQNLKKRSESDKQATSETPLRHSV